ncbi:MAG: acetolactate synthase [Verrucomicrobiota bacterium]
MAISTSIRKDSTQNQILQFSVYADNKVGRLNDLIGALTHANLHILAMTVLDTTDSSIIRLIADYHEDARQILKDHKFTFNEVEMVAVEVNMLSDIHKVTCALVQAEVNLHYIYPFLARPSGSTAFAMRLEDSDIATSVLQSCGIRILSRSDLAR